MTHDFPVIALMALLGLVCGSFLNVLIHRLPIMIEQSWAEPTSANAATLNHPTIFPEIAIDGSEFDGLPCMQGLLTSEVSMRNKSTSSSVDFTDSDLLLQERHTHRCSNCNNKHNCH